MTDDARPPKGEAQNELVKLVEELHLPEEKKKKSSKLSLASITTRVGCRQQKRSQDISSLSLMQETGY